MPTIDPNTQFVLHGRVVSDGSGVSGLSVQAFDYDFGRPVDDLGTTTTGDDGAFEITFRQSAAGSRSEGTPEPFVVIHDAEGTLLAQTRWIRLDTETTLDLDDIHVVVKSPVEDPSSAPIGGDPGVTPGTAPEPKDPSSKPGGATHHGSKSRDFVAPRSPFYRGPFGRLFRELPAWIPPGATDEEKAAVVAALAATMVEEEGDTETGDHPNIPAAYTYFGQFVDHDITFDPASSLTKQNDPDRLINFRSPAFDLDNLYGGGPDDEPFLYDRNSRDHFLIGKGRRQRTSDDGAIDLVALPKTSEDDLPRNEQGRALIGDPRNDENLIVSQLQLAFLKFHNATLDAVKERLSLTGREAFFRAQQIVRWHYQWIVLFDFLPRIVGEDMAQAVLTPRGERKDDVARAEAKPFTIDLRHYNPKESAFMPVEFSAAAYRFGHSLVRGDYDLNRVVRRVPIFRPPSQNPGPLADLRGGRPLPGLWSLDWRRFLDLDAGTPAQRARLVDTRLSRGLAAIPSGPGKENPLALLNLVRGWRLGLPSGQAVAQAMGTTVLSNEDLGLDIAEVGHEAPLWFYVLKEGELLHDGLHMGPVGGRIVGEVFVGLAAADSSSFLNQAPTWTPGTAFPDGPLIEPLGEGFQLRDVLRFVGLDGEPF
ncbi:peroxidase family protein [Rubricoccus marinus]|uniref:peroxidase family protein n=1 Tax=Rubricoccus marinus TaxID=716817 RepID=UPI0015C622A7|nr:heme peroxidase family protein [Rubricoccus marinus]